MLEPRGLLRTRRVDLEHRAHLPAPHSRKQYNKDPNPELSNGRLIALDSDAAWARRAGMISYLPCSARVVRLAAQRPVPFALAAEYFSREPQRNNLNHLVHYCEGAIEMEEDEGTFAPQNAKMLNSPCGVFIQMADALHVVRGADSTGDLVLVDLGALCILAVEAMQSECCDVSRFAPRDTAFPCASAAVLPKADACACSRNCLTPNTIATTCSASCARL